MTDRDCKPYQQLSEPGYAARLCTKLLSLQLEIVEKEENQHVPLWYGDTKNFAILKRDGKQELADRFFGNLTVPDTDSRVTKCMRKSTCLMTDMKTWLEYYALKNQQSDILEKLEKAKKSKNSASKKEYEQNLDQIEDRLDDIEKDKNLCKPWKAAHVEATASFLCSLLVRQGMTPSFPLFYGERNIMTTSKTEMPPPPVKIMYTEDLDGGLIDLYNWGYFHNYSKKIPEKVDCLKIMSLMAQITAALAAAQEAFRFFHGSLRVENVKFKRVDIKKALPYARNGSLRWEVPTFGVEFKITNFESALFSLNLVTFASEDNEDPTFCGREENHDLFTFTNNLMALLELEPYVNGPEDPPKGLLPVIQLMRNILKYREEEPDTSSTHAIPRCNLNAFDHIFGSARDKTSKEEPEYFASQWRIWD
jgi:hypothetical protein